MRPLHANYRQTAVRRHVNSFNCSKRLKQIFAAIPFSDTKPDTIPTATPNCASRLSTPRAVSQIETEPRGCWPRTTADGSNRFTSCLPTIQNLISLPTTSFLHADFMPGGRPFV